MVQIMADFVGYTGNTAKFIKMVQQLDQHGVDGAILSDDLWLHDVFTIHGALAGATSHIKLAFVTNPYSRHPALVARSAATLSELTDGRVIICYAAGGSFTLQPLKIPMWDRPITHVREAIQVCRQLLTGEEVTYQGKRFELEKAQLKFPIPSTIPKFYIAGRGPKIMSLTGELADGAIVEPISPAYEQMIMQRIRKTASQHGRSPDKIVFHTPITYLQKPEKEFAQYAALRIANVLQDTPLSLLETFEADVSQAVMTQLKQIHDAPNSESAAKLVTPEIAELYHGWANSPESLLEVIEEKTRQGFKSVGIVVPYGEEQNVVTALTEDLIAKVHKIP